MVRKAKAKRGRPTKSAQDRKSVMLTARIRLDLKEKLDRAAASAGRSLGQEVDNRLGRSFERRPDFFGDDRSRYLGMVVARLATWVEMQTGANWRDDRWAFDALVSGLQTILLQLRPQGEPKIPERQAGFLDAVTKAGRSDIAALESTPEGCGRNSALGMLSAMMGRAIGPEDQGNEWNNDLPRAGKVLGLLPQQKESKS